MSTQRHPRRDPARLLEVRAVRAHAESFNVDDRTSFERGFALVRARKCDTCLDTPVERRSSRRIVSAERHAPHPDTACIDVGARFEIIDYSSDRFFILGTDRE